MKNNKIIKEKQIDTLINQVSIHENKEIRDRYQKIILQKQNEISELDKNMNELEIKILEQQQKVEELKNQLNIPENCNSILYFESLDKEEQKELIQKVIKKICIFKPEKKKYELKYIQFNYEDTIKEIARTMGISKDKIKELIDFVKMEEIVDNFDYILQNLKLKAIVKHVMKEDLMDILKYVWALGDEISYYNRINPELDDIFLKLTDLDIFMEDLKNNKFEEVIKKIDIQMNENEVIIREEENDIIFTKEDLKTFP